MKKFNVLLVFVMLVVAGVFVGCTKESEVLETNKTKSVSEEVIYAKNGMLVFSDMEAFKNTLKQLEDDNLSHQKQLSEVISTFKTEREVNSYIQKINWNYDLTFETFEKQFNYVFLRSVIARKMIDFNKIYDQKGIKNPDNHFVGDVCWRTLLNEKCEVIIGTSIYKMINKDLTIEIKNLNFDIAEKINEQNILNFDLNEEIFIYGEISSKAWQECQSNYITDWYTSNTYLYDGAYRRISGRLEENNYFTGAHNIKVYTKTEYSNGHDWKTWTTTQKSYLTGVFYNGNSCKNSPLIINYIISTINGFSTIVTRDFDTFSLKSGNITSVHKAIGCGADSLVLKPTW